MNFLIIALVLIYTVLTGVLRLSGSGSLDSASDRIVIADVLGLFLVLIATFVTIRKNSLLLPNSLKNYLPLIFIFILSGFFSYHPDRSIIEILATVLGFIVCLSLLNLLIHLNEEALQKFFYLYFILMGSFFLFFVSDFLFLNIVSRPIGGLTGTFRNTGQAGAFIGIHLAIMIPLLLSGIVKKNLLVQISLFFSILALILTFKRAAMLGFSVGLILLIIILFFSKNKSDKKLFIILFFAITIIGWLLLIAFNWGLENVDGMMGRWNSKFASDTISNFEEGFLASNITATINAFSNSPLIGIGLGNVETTDFAHEIHSTYMAIIATSGLLGVIAYMYFIFTYTKLAFKNFLLKGHNKYYLFYYYYIPFYLGLLVSWGYTYHLRKREFWILMAITLLISYLAKRANTSKSMSSQ